MKKALCIQTKKDNELVDGGRLHKSKGVAAVQCKWLLNIACYKLQNARPDACSHLNTNAKRRGQAALRANMISQWAANAVGIFLFPPLCSYFFSFSSSSGNQKIHVR